MKQVVPVSGGLCSACEAGIGGTHPLFVLYAVVAVMLHKYGRCDGRKGGGTFNTHEALEGHSLIQIKCQLVQHHPTVEAQGFAASRDFATFRKRQAVNHLHYAAIGQVCGGVIVGRV